MVLACETAGTPNTALPAMALLANYPVPGLETVAQFAKRAGVSGPTILRLVAKLGFASYPRFQQALRDELELRLQPPLAKMPSRKVRQADPDFLNEYADHSRFRAYEEKTHSVF